ncbi:MAG: glycosyltransferase family 4 protein [Planctomycetota bacterium]
MRILQLITSFSFAGAERIALDLCTLAGCHVELAALTPGNGQLRVRAEARGISCHDLAMRHKADLAVVGRLRDRLEAGRFDLLHTHLVHADIIGRLATQGRTPTLSTLHLVERRWRPWHGWGESLTARWARAFVAVSPAVLEHGVHRWGLPLEKMHLIPNGVSLEGIPGSTRDIDILFLGRLDRQKGLDRLLPGLALAQKTQPLKVAIAGIGPEEASLKTLAMAHGVDAQWMGFVENAASLMARAKVVAVPSRWEGFGLVAAEALAAGCDVVHSGVPPLTWVTGTHGTVLPKGPKDIASLMVERVTRFEENAQRRQWVASMFSLESMKKSYVELYTACAASPA